MNALQIIEEPIEDRVSRLVEQANSLSSLDLRALVERGKQAERELAQELGVSVGSLNYCLKALIDKGWVKMQNFSQSKNKFGYVYILTPTGMAEKAALTSRFLKRKMSEYEALKAEIDALQNEDQTET
jgi:EPS-associated MarR family transcriptional regulator